MELCSSSVSRICNHLLRFFFVSLITFHFHFLISLFNFINALPQYPQRLRSDRGQDSVVIQPYILPIPKRVNLKAVLNSTKLLLIAVCNLYQIESGCKEANNISRIVMHLWIEHIERNCCLKTQLNYFGYTLPNIHIQSQP